MRTTRSVAHQTQTVIEHAGWLGINIPGYLPYMGRDQGTERGQAVGRAQAKKVGRARVGAAMGVARTPDRAHTRVLRDDEGPRTAVFVDDSGRRSRRLRRAALATGAVLLVLVALLWLSQYGGPVGPGN
jgi:hypothetical protein